MSAAAASAAASAAAKSIKLMPNAKLGWIGTGVMGEQMCGHLIRQGYQVSVFSRTRSKLTALLKQGATECSSPAEVAKNSTVLCTMLGFPHDVQQVILGQGEALQHLAPGSLLIDFTTSSPELARAIAEEAAKKNVAALDAPVSGGDVGARNATLSIMCGGSKSAFDSAVPLLEVLGTPRRLGDAGAGQSCKLGNQVAIACTMVSLCESMLFAHRQGLHVKDFIEAIGGGAAGSKSLDLYATRIMSGDMAPGFKVNHFVKDLKLAIEAADRVGLSLPGLALAKTLYVSLQGHADDGELGTQSLIRALERLNSTHCFPPSHS